MKAFIGANLVRGLHELIETIDKSIESHGNGISSWCDRLVMGNLVRGARHHPLHTALEAIFFPRDLIAFEIGANHPDGSLSVRIALGRFWGQRS